MITKREIIIAMKLHFCLFYSIVKISTVEIKARFLFAIHKMVNLSFLHTLHVLILIYLDCYVIVI